jgi:hypothetical protein
MSWTTETLGARLDELTRELRQVEARLARLEVSRDTSPESGEVGEADQEFELPRITPESLSFAGRTLIVIGGAFLLRAVTEAGVIPPTVGPIVALVYAAWWMVHADRSAQAGRRSSAAFHGFTAIAISYPLIYEATARLQILSPLVGAAALVLMLVLGIVVAVRNDLPWLASFSTLAAVTTAMILMISTAEVQLFAIALLLVAVAVEALAFTDRWHRLRWLVAIPLDLMVLHLGNAAVAPESLPDGHPPLQPEAVVAIAVALPLIYLAGIGARTLQSKRQITPFEIVQAGLALAIGLGSALRVITYAGAGSTSIAVASLVLGVACSAIAFAFIERDEGAARNFYTYNTYALILVLAGTWLLLSGSGLALTWSVLAIVAVAVGGRFERQSLKFHGVAYLIAAGFQIDLLAFAFEGLFVDPSMFGVPFSPALLAVAVASVCCYAILLATAVPTDFPQRDRWPEGLVAVIVAWSAAGIAGWLLAGWLMELVAPEISRPFVATARTGVLAGLAVALAWFGRRWSLLELTWLVYPVMTIGAGKLLWEDFPVGRPLTIFMALALYGGALLVTPRLVRAVSATEEH